jgi:hypothetical protein
MQNFSTSTATKNFEQILYLSAQNSNFQKITSESHKNGKK